MMRIRRIFLFDHVRTDIPQCPECGAVRIRKPADLDSPETADDDGPGPADKGLEGTSARARVE